MPTLSSFRSIKNKHVYRGKEWMNELKTQRENAMKIINFERKMKLLTEEWQKSYENVKAC